MLVTEEKARKKWCPMATGKHIGQTCIVSDCMAWRWYAAKFGTVGAPDSVQDDYGESVGYCGLAGTLEGK